MRIAVTYDYDSKEVFQHFGKTENFLLVDVDGDERKETIVTNGGFSHHELAGYLKDLGVEVLLAGGMGAHAIEFLKQAGIKAYPGNTGPARDVAEKFIKGELNVNPNTVHLCDCHDHDHDHNH